MALEFITISSQDGDRKVTCDVHDSDRYCQVTKLGYGADGTTPTLVSSSNPLPTVGKTTTAGFAGAVSIGTSAGIVRSAEPNRITLTIRNHQSGVMMFWGYDQTQADSANAFPLYPSEGRVFADYKGAIWARAAAAGSDLRFAEEGDGITS